MQLYHQLVDIRDDLRRFVERSLKPDSRLLKIVIGVGVGAAVGFISYEVYLKLWESKLRIPPEGPQKALNDVNVKVNAKLVQRKVAATNVHCLKFALPSHSLRIAPGNGITLTAVIDGETVVKHFSSVSAEEDHGQWTSFSRQLTT